MVSRYLASTLGEDFRRARWYKGTVAAVHSDGTINVHYEDGDFEKNVLPCHFRALSLLPRSSVPGLQGPGGNPDWLYGRLEGRLLEGQQFRLQSVLSHCDWLKDFLKNSSTPRLEDVHEVLYCRKKWLAHFSQGASDTRTQVIEDLSARSQQFAMELEDFSLSLARCISPAVGPCFVVRKAAGMAVRLSACPTSQVQVAWHPDQLHLGDYIVNVTVYGDCVAEVARYENSAAQRESRCWRSVQTAGCYYGIFGPSLKPLRHRVLSHSNSTRLSITFRFVDGEPSIATPYSAASTEASFERIHSRKQSRAAAAQPSSCPPSLQLSTRVEMAETVSTSVGSTTSDVELSDAIQQEHRTGVTSTIDTRLLHVASALSLAQLVTGRRVCVDGLECEQAFAWWKLVLFLFFVASFAVIVTLMARSSRGRRRASERVSPEASEQATENVVTNEGENAVDVRLGRVRSVSQYVLQQASELLERYLQRARSLDRTREEIDVMLAGVAEVTRRSTSSQAQIDRGNEFLEQLRQRNVELTQEQEELSRRSAELISLVNSAASAYSGQQAIQTELDASQEALARTQISPPSPPTSPPASPMLHDVGLANSIVAHIINAAHDLVELSMNSPSEEHPHADLIHRLLQLASRVNDSRGLPGSSAGDAYGLGTITALELERALTGELQSMLQCLSPDSAAVREIYLALWLMEPLPSPQPSPPSTPPSLPLLAPGEVAGTGMRNNASIVLDVTCNGAVHLEHGTNATDKEETSAPKVVTSVTIDRRFFQLVLSLAFKPLAEGLHVCVYESGCEYALAGWELTLLLFLGASAAVIYTVYNSIRTRSRTRHDPAYMDVERAAHAFREDSSDLRIYSLRVNALHQFTGALGAERFTRSSDRDDSLNRLDRSISISRGVLDGLDVILGRHREMFQRLESSQAEVESLIEQQPESSPVLGFIRRRRDSIIRVYESLSRQSSDVSCLIDDAIAVYSDQHSLRTELIALGAAPPDAPPCVMEPGDETDSCDEDVIEEGRLMRTRMPPNVFSASSSYGVPYHDGVSPWEGSAFACSSYALDSHSVSHTRRCFALYVQALQWLLDPVTHAFRTWRASASFGDNAAALHCVRRMLQSGWASLCRLLPNKLEMAVRRASASRAIAALPGATASDYEVYQRDRACIQAELRRTLSDDSLLRISRAAARSSSRFKRSFIWWRAVVGTRASHAMCSHHSSWWRAYAIENRGCFLEPRSLISLARRRLRVGIVTVVALVRLYWRACDAPVRNPRALCIHSRFCPLMFGLDGRLLHPRGHKGTAWCPRHSRPWHGADVARGLRPHECWHKAGKYRYCPFVVCYDAHGVPDHDIGGRIVAHNGEQGLHLHLLHPARRIILMAWHATRQGVFGSVIAIEAFVALANFLKSRRELIALVSRPPSPPPSPPSPSESQELHDIPRASSSNDCASQSLAYAGVCSCTFAAERGLVCTHPNPVGPNGLRQCCSEFAWDNHQGCLRCNCLCPGCSQDDSEPDSDSVRSSSPPPPSSDLVCYYPCTPDLVARWYSLRFLLLAHRLHCFLQQLHLWTLAVYVCTTHWSSRYSRLAFSQEPSSSVLTLDGPANEAHASYVAGLADSGPPDDAHTSYVAGIADIIGRTQGLELDSQVERQALAPSGYIFRAMLSLIRDRRAATRIQARVRGLFSRNELRYGLALVVVWPEGAARVVNRRVVVPDDSEAQHFNYYHATLRDVFHYMIERLDMGSADTHFLRTLAGRTLFDLDQTLYASNRGRSRQTVSIRGGLFFELCLMPGVAVPLGVLSGPATDVFAGMFVGAPNIRASSAVIRELQGACGGVDSNLDVNEVPVGEGQNSRMFCAGAQWLTDVYIYELYDAWRRGEMERVLRALSPLTVAEMRALYLAAGIRWGALIANRFRILGVLDVSPSAFPDPTPRIDAFIAQFPPRTKSDLLYSWSLCTVGVPMGHVDRLVGWYPFAEPVAVTSGQWPVIHPSARICVRHQLVMQPAKTEPTTGLLVKWGMKSAFPYWTAEQISKDSRRSYHTVSRMAVGGLPQNDSSAASSPFVQSASVGSSIPLDVTVTKGISHLPPQMSPDIFGSQPTQRSLPSLARLNSIVIHRRRTVAGARHSRSCSDACAGGVVDVMMTSPTRAALPSTTSSYGSTETSTSCFHYLASYADMLLQHACSSFMPHLGAFSFFTQSPSSSAFPENDCLTLLSCARRDESVSRDEEAPCSPPPSPSGARRVWIREGSTVTSLSHDVEKTEDEFVLYFQNRAARAKEAARVAARVHGINEKTVRDRLLDDWSQANLELERSIYRVDKAYNAAFDAGDMNSEVEVHAVSELVDFYRSFPSMGSVEYEHDSDASNYASAYRRVQRLFARRLANKGGSAYLQACRDELYDAEVDRVEKKAKRDKARAAFSAWQDRRYRKVIEGRHRQPLPLSGYVWSQEPATNGTPEEHVMITIDNTTSQHAELPESDDGGSSSTSPPPPPPSLLVPHPALGHREKHPREDKPGAIMVTVSSDGLSQNTIYTRAPPPHLQSLLQLTCCTHVVWRLAPSSPPPSPPPSPASLTSAAAAAQQLIDDNRWTEYCISPLALLSHDEKEGDEGANQVSELVALHALASSLDPSLDPPQLSRLTTLELRLSLNIPPSAPPSPPGSPSGWDTDDGDDEQYQLAADVLPVVPVHALDWLLGVPVNAPLAEANVLPADAVPEAEADVEMDEVVLPAAAAHDPEGMPIEPPVAPPVPNFIPAFPFAGAMPGYVFQMGLQGVGYYLDNPPPLAAAEEMPEQPPPLNLHSHNHSPSYSRSPSYSPSAARSPPHERAAPEGEAAVDAEGAVPQSHRELSVLPLYSYRLDEVALPSQAPQFAGPYLRNNCAHQPPFLFVNPCVGGCGAWRVRCAHCWTSWVVNCRCSQQRLQEIGLEALPGARFFQDMAALRAGEELTPPFLQATCLTERINDVAFRRQWLEGRGYISNEPDEYDERPEVERMVPNVWAPHCWYELLVHGCAMPTPSPLGFDYERKWMRPELAVNPVVAASRSLVILMQRFHRSVSTAIILLNFMREDMHLTANQNFRLLAQFLRRDEPPDGYPLFLLMSLFNSALHGQMEVLVDAARDRVERYAEELITRRRYDAVASALMVRSNGHVAVRLWALSPPYIDQGDTFLPERQSRVNIVHHCAEDAYASLTSEWDVFPHSPPFHALKINAFPALMEVRKNVSICFDLYENLRDVGLVDRELRCGQGLLRGLQRDERNHRDALKNLTIDTERPCALQLSSEDAENAALVYGSRDDNGDVLSEEVAAFQLALNIPLMQPHSGEPQHVVEQTFERVGFSRDQQRVFPEPDVYGYYEGSLQEAALGKTKNGESFHTLLMRDANHGDGFSQFANGFFGLYDQDNTAVLTSELLRELFDEARQYESRLRFIQNSVMPYPPQGSACWPPGTPYPWEITGTTDARRRRRRRRRRRDDDDDDHTYAYPSRTRSRIDAPSQEMVAREAVEAGAGVHSQ
ncbi:MAG: hypothetical protein CBB71_18705 [Rhodopirellula sp. TMED11]|nr:MAG: hypothetical protein CBB71_18705 [Rhodopirellula sp. TMED11]